MRNGRRARSGGTRLGEVSLSLGARLDISAAFHSRRSTAHCSLSNVAADFSVLLTELAAQGTVPSETSMRKWKAAYDAEAKQLRDQQSVASESIRPPASASPVLTALEENKAGHGEESA